MHNYIKNWKKEIRKHGQQWWAIEKQEEIKARGLPFMKKIQELWSEVK